MDIRVFLVDDHQLMRDSLRALLEQQPNMEVVGEAADGPAAVRRVRQCRPDVVVMDIGLPGLSGIEVTRRVVADIPDIRVLGLSVHSDRRYVSDMLEAGASGYVLKDDAFEDLVVAVKAVAGNETYLSPGLAGKGVAEPVVNPFRRKLP